MFLYIIFFSVFAWSTSKCEPPVNSYLPPATGNAGSPPPQYGPPEVGGNGRSGNPRTVGNQRQNQPQDSYSIPEQAGSLRPLDTQYGPPSSGRGSGQGSSRPSQFGSQSEIEFQAPRNNNEPNQLYGAPNGARRQGSGPLEEAGQLPPPFNGPNEGPQSSYNSPRGRGNSEPSGRSNGFGPSESRFGQRPDSSYGPPPSGDFRPGNGGQSSQGPQGGLGSFSAALRDDGASSFHQKPPLNGSPSSSYGTPGFSNGPGDRGSSDSGSSFGGESGEPAKYEFSYDVDDAQSGTKFGHSEQRDGDTATGQYNVELPDGRKQVVEYEAGLQGYKPQIRYEGGRNGAAGGFGNGNNENQGGNGGYPRVGPGGSNNDIGYPGSRQDSRPGKYQQSGDFNQNGPELSGQDFMGYPRGGPGGGNGQENRGYPGGDPGQSRSREQSHYPSRNGDNNLNSLNGGMRGGRPFTNAVNRGNGGYSRGGPQESTNNRGSEGYPGGSPQGNTDNGGSEGYPRGGPPGSNGNYSQDNERRFSSEGTQGPYRGEPSKGASGNNRNNGDEGYPRGGPSGPRGSGY